MRVVIVGAGDVGANIADRLVKEGLDVALIDHDAEVLANLNETLDVQTVLGNGSDPEVLKAAGLDEAELLVAVSGSDEANLLACRYSQLLAPLGRRMARLRNRNYYEPFDREVIKKALGLDWIISPEEEAVQNILDLLDVPGAADVISLAGGRLSLVGVRVFEDNPLVGLTLAQSLAREAGCNLLIAAIYRNHELLIPRGNTVILSNDLVYLTTTPNGLGQARNFFALSQRPVKSVMIVGGGQVGYNLALALEKKKNVAVKLIEAQAARASFLAGRLSRAIVLKGDGTDQNLLLEENIASSDAFVAVTTDDEKNVISCLLAKRLGVKNLITRVNRFSYVPLVMAIGLESLVSSRVAAVSASLKHIRRGRVLSLATLKSEDAEIIEFEVPPQCRIAGKPVSKSAFPKGSLAVALIRGDEVIIPKGDTVIKPNDSLVVVARPGMVREMERLLSVRADSQPPSRL